MSDKTLEAVKALLYGQSRAKAPQLDAIHEMELAKGRRAKRTLDARRTNQDYYRVQTIQQPLLDHYENVDWFERDTEYDLVRR